MANGMEEYIYQIEYSVSGRIVLVRFQRNRAFEVLMRLLQSVDVFLSAAKRPGGSVDTSPETRCAR